MDQAIVSGSNFLTGILVARFLGIESFGVYTLLWAVVIFVLSIQMSVISQPMMTIAPKQPVEYESKYYGAVITNQLVFSFISSFLLWLSVFVVAKNNPEWGLLNLAIPLAFSSFFFQNQDFVRRFFFVRKKTLLSISSDSIGYFGRLVLIIIFFQYFYLDVEVVLWIITASSAIAIFPIILSTSQCSFNFRESYEVFKRHWILSKWMSASAVLQWASGNYFILISGGILGPVAVGALKATQNIIGVTHVLFQALENVVPSKASTQYHNKGIASLRDYLIKVAAWGGGITLSIVIFVSSFPTEILHAIYGSQYLKYDNILRWYAISYLIMFFAFPIRTWFRVTEISHPIFLAYVSMLVFSILFSNFLINNWGLNGAGLGIFFMQIVHILTLLYFFIKYKYLY